MADMRDRLIELIENAYYCDIERLADHLLANGVILPPCKVGDTVYRLDDYLWDSESSLCEHYRVGGFGDPSECCKTSDGRKSAECIKIVEIKMTYKNILQYLAFEDFGKTVFLTREEAEKALREKEK